MANKIKLQTRSFITYRKMDKDDEDVNKWFVITRNKGNKRVEFSFPSEDDAIEAWKAHIADNLIDKSGDDQRFTALVKNMEGRWNYQLIYTHDAKNKKSTIVKEEIKQKDKKEEPKKEVVKKEPVKKEEPKQEVKKEEPKKEEPKQVVEANNYDDGNYIKIKRFWVYVYLLLLFVALGLSIWAFVLWVQ